MQFLSTLPINALDPEFQFLPGRIEMCRNSYEYACILQEEDPGYFVLNVNATDNDGPDDAIRYSFLTGNEHADHQKFTMNAVTGEIHTAKKLDREVQENYNVSIRKDI